MTCACARSLKILDLLLHFDSEVFKPSKFRWHLGSSTALAMVVVDCSRLARLRVKLSLHEEKDAILDATLPVEECDCQAA